MSAKDKITHPGIIDRITDDTVFVRILAMSACSTCHSKSMCSISEIEEKIIEVGKDPSRNYKEGDHVTVTMKESLGGKAVLLGYILPFLLMIAVLVLLVITTGNEGLAGLSSIVVLIPYYWLLYIYRSRLKKTFSFTIE